MSPRSPADRQALAIARVMERRRGELAPARAEIAELIDRFGWRRARPIVHGALNRPVQRVGLWRLNKTDTKRVLDALREGPKGQVSLFDQRDQT